MKISCPVIEETRVRWLGLRYAFNTTDNLNHLSMCFLPKDRFKQNRKLATYRRSVDSGDWRRVGDDQRGGTVGRYGTSGGWRREEDWRVEGKRGAGIEGG